MDEKQDISMDVIRGLIGAQSAAITEHPVSFPVELEDITMLPKGKEIKAITIKPIKVRTVAQLMPLLVSIESEDLKKISTSKERAFDPEAVQLFQKYHKTILEVLCVGIHNKAGDYPAWFRQMIEANFTWQELHVFLNAILYRMGSQSFQNSIILSNRMSPMEDKGIIAMSKNLKKHLISIPS